MATKISEQELANLAINLVKSPSAFQQMQQANQIQPDEFYLVEGDDAATYTFQDFTNGRFIVNQTKNGVVTPMTINTGSITGGSAITNDATVIGGIVPTGVQGYELSALKKTISGQNGVVVSASGTNSIIIGLDAVTGLTAGSVGPISAISPAHGGTVSIPYITYDTYGRITSAVNRVLTLPAETQLSAAVPNGVTAYNAGQTNDFYVVGGLTTANHKITVAKKKLSAGAAMTITTASNEIVIAHSDTSTLAAGAHNAGDGAFIRSITTDEYGHITAVSTANETAETQLSGGSGEENLKVITGISVNNHEINVAKRTLSATGALSIASGTGTFNITHNQSVLAASTYAAGNKSFIKSITTDAYGHIIGYTFGAESTAPTIAIDSNASDPNHATLIAGLTAEDHLIKVARKTITAGTGIVVNNTTSAITIGIQSLTVSASTATTSLAHGGTVVLPSSITVNNLGQVTAIKTTTYTMPGETQLSVGSNAGATNCELINSITVNNHAITLTKSKIVAGTAIAVASKNNNGQYNIEISHGSTNAASTLTPAADTFINGLTLDSFGHVVGISTAVESTGASLSVSSNAGDNGMVITGITLGGDHNHEITVVKRTISAGNAITVSTTTAGKIIVNHSVTSSAVTVASAAGKFVNAISIDTYGHVTGMTTTSETVLSASGTTGTENNKVITGLAFSGHQIYAAKKTLEGLNGVTVTNATDKLSIGLTTTITAAVASNYYGATGATSGVSSNKTLSYSSEANRTFYVPYIKVNDRGRVIAIGSNSVTIPSSVAIAAGTNSGAAADTTVVGGISASNNTVTAAKKTLSGTNGISVTASSNTGISIGISSISVGVTSGTKTLKHGDTITVASSVTVNTLGQTTAVKNIALTLPSETGITFAENVSGGDNGQVITGFTFSGHQITSVARRSIVGGGMIAVNTDTAGQISIAHSTPSSVGSNITAASGKFLSGITLDSYGHVTAVTTSSQVGETSLSWKSGTTAGEENLKIITGLALSGTASHTLEVVKRTITPGSAITVSTAANGILNIAHSDTSNQSSVKYTGGNFVSVVSLDAMGHVIKLASAAETAISLSTVEGQSGGNVDLQFVTGLTLGGTHQHKLTIARKAIAVNTGALSISEANNTVTISHNAITPTSSTVTSSRTYINSLTFDAYGHVKSYTTNTESVQSGVQNRLAYYSGVNAISAATNLYADNSSITIGSGVAPDGPAGTIFQVVGNSVMKNIYPDITNAQDLGSLLRRWQSGYFSNNISITASTTAADPVTDESNGIYLDGTNGHIHISHASDPLIYFYNNTNRSNTILHALSSTLNLVSNLYLPQVTSLVESQTGGLLTYAAFPCSGIGSLTSPTYVTTAGEVVKTAYDLSATVNSGLANHVAWYSGDNNVVSAISMTTSGAKLGINMDVVPSTYTYNSRSIEPMLEVNGIIAAHEAIETPAYFMNNTVAADSSNGYYLRANDVTIGRFYLSSIGTTTQLGESIFYIGNSIAEGSDNNSRGRIRIYSKGTNYTQILVQSIANNTSFILPKYDGDMYAVHAGNNNAVGSHIKPVYVEANGRIAPISGTVGSGTKPIYLSSGTLTASNNTVGTNLKPVYLSSGTITVGAYELKATVNSGTAKGLAYYSGTNAISCEPRIFQNRSNRYPLDFTLRNDAGNTVAEIWYDAGDTTNVTSGSWRFRAYSPNSTASTSTTGYYESYYLPTVNTGRTTSAAYNILTTKNLITVAQGGTGASTAAGARANLATWAYINDTYPTIIGPDGTTNAWFKIGTANTSYGILPSQSGVIGSGHNYLGTSSWYWKYSYIDEMYGHHLTLQGTTDATMTAASANPRITFSEGTGGSQPVHLIYTDYDGYRAPAGLKVIGGTSATPAWFEVEGNVYSKAYSTTNYGTAAPTTANGNTNGMLYFQYT